MCVSLVRSSCPERVQWVSWEVSARRQLLTNLICACIVFRDGSEKEFYEEQAMHSSTDVMNPVISLALCGFFESSTCLTCCLVQLVACFTGWRTFHGVALSSMEDLVGVILEGVELRDFAVT